MSSKIFFGLLATVLIIQNVTGNCLRNIIVASDSQSAVTAPWQPPTGCDILSVSSGSPVAPAGISINGQNLEIVGPLAVTGSLPFASSVFLNGDVPSNGQASVAYSSAPGVGLTSGGCGHAPAPRVVANAVECGSW